MDALFGLPRKKAAGISHRDPLHQDLFFCQQSDVDVFLAESAQQKASSNVYNYIIVTSSLTFWI